MSCSLPCQFRTLTEIDHVPLGTLCHIFSKVRNLELAPSSPRKRRWKRPRALEKKSCRLQAILFDDNPQRKRIGGFQLIQVADDSKYGTILRQAAARYEYLIATRLVKTQPTGLSPLRFFLSPTSESVFQLESDLSQESKLLAAVHAFKAEQETQLSSELLSVPGSIPRSSSFPSKDSKTHCQQRRFIASISKVVLGRNDRIMYIALRKKKHEPPGVLAKTTEWVLLEKEASKPKHQSSCLGMLFDGEDSLLQALIREETLLCWTLQDISPNDKAALLLPERVGDLEGRVVQVHLSSL